MAHAKIYRFDERLLIGSCNLDDLSLYRNDELDLGFEGAAVPALAEPVFEELIAASIAGRPLDGLAGADRRAAAREVVAMAVSGSARRAPTRGGDGVVRARDRVPRGRHRPRRPERAMLDAATARRDADDRSRPDRAQGLRRPASGSTCAIGSRP